MLVDVVRMRAGGQRLPNDAVKAMRPIRGHLVISTEALRDPHGATLPLTTATLGGSGGVELLPALHDASVTRMSGNAFIVSGHELFVPEAGASERRAQSWWCRLGGR
jgi:hypothetical protein